MVTARMERILSRGTLTALVGLTYGFLLIPILVIVYASFSPDLRYMFSPGEASIHWYREFYNSKSFTSAFRFSLILASIASAIATVIGFITAYGIVRYLKRYRFVAQAFVMLPMMTPTIVISLGLLLLMNSIEIPEMLPMLCGHVVICLPFTVAGIIASLEGIDPVLEDAAWTLGASRMTILREITLPLVAPGVLSAMIFSFVVSFGDVYVSLFLAAPGTTTLPVEIFSYVQWESTPIVAAITTVQMILIIVFGLVVERIVGLRRAIRI